MRANGPRACGLVLWCGLLGMLASSAAATGLPVIEVDDRRVELSVELQPGAFSSRTRTPQAKGFPWSFSDTLSLAGAGATGTARGSQFSWLTPGRLEARCEANASTFANDESTSYVQAWSVFDVEITIAEATAWSIDGQLSVNHTGFIGRAAVEVTFRELGGKTTLFTTSRDVSGDSALEPISGSGSLQPGLYSVSARATVFLEEVIDDSEQGRAELRFVLNLGDRDGDGLPDVWEESGIDIDGDKSIDLDLPALGADPDKKDLFIEVDAMTGRAPMDGVLDLVVQAFEEAPVTGTTVLDRGINLHAILDETDLTFRDYPQAFADFAVDKAAHFGTKAERASPNWDNIRAAKNLVFRYCIFGNTYSGGNSSGLAEYPGDDFMVTLGGWDTPGGTKLEQAGTFMHELGHTIGLHHGGVDPVNHKPNHFSVMNYRWQTPADSTEKFWRLDYSREKLPDLDESALVENDGLGSTEPLYVDVFVPFPSGSAWAWGPIENGFIVNWDNDDDTPDVGPVAVDINRSEPADTSNPGGILRGSNDWELLWYHLSGAAGFADGVSSTTIADEFDLDDLAVLRSIPPAPGAACEGDLDGDNDTDVFDFFRFLELFGATGLEPGSPGDYDGDGDVDVMDYDSFAADFGCS